MRRKNDSRRIEARAKRRFLRALRRGRRLQEAAAIAGHSEAGFCALRRRDSSFARQWAQAMEASSGPRLIRPNNRRRLQWRRMRHVRFTETRKEIFLNHLAGCCDVEESARVAGVDRSTVYKHRRKDPVFAAGFQEVIEQGYLRLETEALCQRVRAQERLRRALDQGIPTGEVTEEFERVIKLLDRWDRRNGRIGVRTASRERRPSLSFDEAIALLETKLRNLGIPILELPPAIAAPYEAPDEAPDEEAGEGGDDDSGPPE